MTSSPALHEVPLPETATEGVIGSKATDEGTRNINKNSSNHPCCLCPHAIARDSQIYGRTERRKRDESENLYESTSLFFSWQTSLAPHRVTQIVSNRDGSILAAATNAGTVSLLRGSDGKVLATRQVAKNTSASLSFVSNADDGDTLLIQTPSASQDDPVHCVVVSNIQGLKLNGRPESAAEAARQLKISAVPRNLPAWKETARVTALYENPHTLLLTAVTQQGQLRLFAWDLAQNVVTVRKEAVSLQLSTDEETEWVVDHRLGLATQSVCEQNYVVFATYAPGKAALAWLDPIVGHCVSHVPLEIRVGQMGAFLPLESHEATLAVAMAVKTETATQINVYQQVVEETMGLIVLSKPHLIFSVPVEAPLRELSLSEVLHSDIYAFEFQYSRKGTFLVSELRPSESSLASIGKIRYLLQVGKFDQADELLASLDDENLDPLASFHPSEVASRRLKKMVSENRTQSEDITSCLERLAAGAATMNKTAIATFAQACEMIPDKALGESVDQQIAVIVRVLRFIDNAIEAEAALDTSEIKAVENKLQDRRRALRFVAALPDEIVSMNLIGIKSTRDLVQKLLVDKQYLLIEKLWEWEGSNGISVDVLLEEMVKLPAHVDPTGYLPVLKNVLFPNLFVHHELLPIFLAWCCESADLMDENDVGLSTAVKLLEVVQNGVQMLRQKLYASFATESPFVEGLQIRKGLRSTVSTRAEGVTKTTSSHPKRQAPPTIVKLGGLRAGATKTSVRTIGKWSTSQDIDEECVEQKLVAAKCLLRARGLGLPETSIRLRELGSTLRLDDCALALLLSLSPKIPSHEARVSFLRNHVKSFCDEIKCGFDDSLLTYITGLCKETEVTSRKILEAASISRCCWSDENKANGTLLVVRAGVLCGTTDTWLLEQAREAIKWASTDSSLRSEVEEAARLLLIDSIVIKYCGKGARELFRVDNPKHAMNLVEFVVRTIKSVEQVSDILDLCDAFLHLPRRDCIVSLLSRGIMDGKDQLCIDVMNLLVVKDPDLADKVLTGTLSFVTECLSEYCATKALHAHASVVRKNSIMQATGVCGELLSIAVQRGRKLSEEFDSDVACFTKAESMIELRDDFLRLHELQTKHDIFVSFGDLRSPQKQIASTIKALKRALKSYVGDDSKGFLTKLKMAQRACALLTGRGSSETEDVWRIAVTSIASSLVSKVNLIDFYKFLDASSILHEGENAVSCRCLVHVATALCADHSQDCHDSASFQEACELSLAALLVREYGLQMSSSATLPSLIEFDTTLDVSYGMLRMTDGGIGDKVSLFREEALRISSTKMPPMDTIENTWSNIEICQPSLHPTWYHGDGLLLPPDVTSMLKTFVRLSEQQSPRSNVQLVGLERLLEEKGCCSARLRVLHVFWSRYLNSPSIVLSESSVDNTILDFESALQSLAERSLGGAGVGMTSGVIDSELSVAFLLALPSKLAFKIYTSTIPVALKTQQYRRLHVLANIGTSICSGASGAIPEAHRLSAWTRQRKLLEQCNNLALQASWWIRFSDRGVDFDPSKFEMSTETNAQRDHYITSLILPCISTLSKQGDPQSVRETVSSFARDFKVDVQKVLESQLEYIESPLEDTWDSSDQRNDVEFCTAAAEHIVRLLKPLDRTRTLRRCVKAFELQDSPLIDYERFSSLLTFYREALVSVLEKESIDPEPFEVELELVDRRKDALEILSSYFTGPRQSQRPNFLGFFQPFDKIFGKNIRLDNTQVSVLGCDEDQFDPLMPLYSVMSSSPDNITSAAALSPLCSSLGLPQGYIHARFLMARFDLASQNCTSLPSFENEVEPVLEKLRSPHDRTLLAEWVAQRYTSDEDSLKCYDLALRAAMQNSSEIEFRRRTTPGLADLETKSLETVRRLTVIKTSISDKLRVVAILRSGAAEKGSCLDRLVSDILSLLDQDSTSSPESLLDFLLRKTSSLAAHWAMDETKALSISQLRQLAELVNTACTALAEQHSHIDPQRHAQLLASAWLFGGNSDSANPIPDVDVQAAPTEMANLSTNLSIIQDEDESEADDFVLDLEGIGKEDGPHWSSSAPSKTVRSQTSEEEPSALKPCSEREESEIDTQLASLRVAFVLSSSIDKHRGTDENSAPRTMSQISSKGPKKRLVGLLSKRGSGKDQSNSNDTAKKIGFQLLQIAFAKKSFKVDVFNDSSQSVSTEADGCYTKTVTYAMRHRALRAASILCPQEILEEICHQEGYLRLALEAKGATLVQCSFGSFVAKEIEEMGLQLPHSDLPQLSTMNFPSYARTLWRHNRDANFNKSKGRFLLLLTELALKGDTVDGEFLGWLLKEMSKVSLPRTKIFALQRIAESPHALACKESEKCHEVLWLVVESTANAILSEAFNLSSSRDSLDDTLAMAAKTIRQLSRIMILLCGVEQEPKLKQLVGILTKLSSTSQCVPLNECVKTILEDIDRHLTSSSITLCYSV